MVESKTNILIIGGGLTGAALMLSLKSLGFSTLLVESKELSPYTSIDIDTRSLALAPASVRILKVLNLWSSLEEQAAPIETIHISERNIFGTARLHAEKNGPLGYVVEMQHISKALHQCIDPLQIIAPATLDQLDSSTGKVIINTANGPVAIQADLIVAADGANSSVRRWCDLSTSTKDYEQYAIAANIGLARDHHHCAYERFTSSGPLALLPMKGHRASLVWSLTASEAQRLSLCSEAYFLKELQLAFGYRLGRLLSVGKRHVYPLKQVIMPQQVKNRVIFVGNAAHTLHPVAGQGFNLGLRDVVTLAQFIAEQGLSPSMLKNYQKARRLDQRNIMRLTDGLIDLFGAKLPALNLMRGMGLMALDSLPFFKKILGRHARGFGGISADLVCGIGLRKKNDQAI